MAILAAKVAAMLSDFKYFILSSHGFEIV